MHFSHIWLCFEKTRFDSKLLPYIAGLMKQISTSLITKIYASIIDILVFIDFFIFFVIDSLVLNSRIFLHYSGLRLLFCSSFRLLNVVFFLCYIVREFYQKTLYSRKLTTRCHFHKMYQLTLHLKMFGQS